MNSPSLLFSTVSTAERRANHRGQDLLSTSRSTKSVRNPTSAGVDEQQVIQAHSRSFSLASKLLPHALRVDVSKLYAWCRWCDDAVDEASDPQVATENLERLRGDVERIYAGDEVQLAESNCLADLAHEYDIPKHLPLDLLSGMESDLHFQPFQDQADLELYCYRAAGVVGIMMCHLMGVTEPAALEKASCLGKAMQMTNIARDVAEDWKRGRCYLPRHWFAVTPDPELVPTDELVRDPVRKLLELAEFNYRQARGGYVFLPTRARMAIRVAAAVYRGIGTVIARNKFRVMQERHFVSFPGKLILGVREGLAEAFDCSRRSVRRMSRWLQPDLPRKTL